MKSIDNDGLVTAEADAIFVDMAEIDHVTTMVVYRADNATQSLLKCTSTKLNMPANIITRILQTSGFVQLSRIIYDFRMAYESMKLCNLLGLEYDMED